MKFPSFELDIHRNKKRSSSIKRTKRTRVTNSAKKDTSKFKRRRYQADVTYLLKKQNGLCAHKECKDHHVAQVSVSNNIKHIDHIFPLKLWKLMYLRDDPKTPKGDPNGRDNIQLLCPNCHSRKTQEDSKKLAKYKQKYKIKAKRSKKGAKKTKINTKKGTQYVWAESSFGIGPRRRVKKSETRQSPDVITGKTIYYYDD